MNTVPLISSGADLVDRIAPIVREGCAAEVAWINHAADGLDYLGIEMPDLAFINFSDPINDNFGLLQTILKDAWLLHTSIVALCDDYKTADRLEEMRSANIVAVLVDDEVERYLPGILDIIHKNQRILFQRAIGADLVQTVSGSYKLDNNFAQAHCYANLVCNYLFNANRIDARRKTHVNLVLVEMLINAIEHGNCGISYDDKGSWLENGGTMAGLIEQKCQDPRMRARRVAFEYTIAPEKSSFTIADEGNGFDWRRLKDPAHADQIEELHGRGIKLTRKYTQNLTYNDKGNAVSFEVEHLRDCANSMPAVFENMAPIAVKPADIIFREGEPGDFLYYIARGRFEVLINGAVVDGLSADDIFMGEMSFLLNHRRSATVRATAPGTLIRISKKDFVEAVRQKPHYALFLSRLLAQRLQRRNTEV